MKFIAFGGLRARAVPVILAIVVFIGADSATARLAAQTTKDETMRIGLVTLSLGMSAAATITAFERYPNRYSLIEGPGSPRSSVGSHQVIVWSLEAEKPKDVLASLMFQDKRLGQITKYWTTGRVGRVRAIDVAMGVYGAIQSAMARGANACAIDTEDQVRREMQSRSALVRCGRRTIRISTDTDAERRLQDVSVWEELEAAWFTWPQ